MSRPRLADRIATISLPLGVLAFGTPLALGMALQVTFNLVDAYLVSRLDAATAPAALGAIGICDQLAAIGSIISFGLSTATAAIMSRRRGRGDWEGTKRVAWQSTLCVLVLGLLFGLVGLFGSGTLMRDVVGAQGQVATLGTEYLRVIVTGNVTIFLLLHLTTMQRALGSSKTPVVLLAASNLINLVLAVLLVFGPGEAPPLFGWGPPLALLLHIPRLGLVGAAWATVLARLIALLPLLYLVIRRFGLFHRDTLGGFDRPLLAQLWQLGWPASTQLVVRVMAMLFVQSLVARFYTTPADQSATIAIGVVFRLETMALFMALGWGSAAQTFVGQNLGAGKPRRAHTSGWLAAAYNVVMVLCLAMLYAHFGKAIVGFFDPDPKVTSLSLGYLTIVGPSYVGLSIGIVLGSAMQGAGAARTTLKLDTAVLLGFLLPVTTWVVFSGMDITRLWIAIAIVNLLMAIVYTWNYRRGSFLKTEVT